MNILNLVTTRGPFFEQQVKTLENNGCNVDTISVPGSADGRKLTHYAKFYIKTLRSVSRQYDIVHANYGLTAPMAIAQPIRPIVLTLWGSDLMGTLQRLSTKYTYFFDKVILPSPAMAPYLSTDYTLLPFGIDTDLFRPIPRDKAREIIGWNTNENIVLFPYRTSRKIKRFGLASQVANELDLEVELRTISNVPYEKVPLYMNASDALLVTSKRESGPMVVKEAALCNVPVVSTDVGFVSDVLSGIDNSYVCCSKSELVNQLEFVLRSECRADGQKHAEEWSLNKMGDQLVSVYESVL
jgi:glycosyltransferase involved in cell wall biosynthesis